MGIEFNPASLNAKEIFQQLDAADGNKDGKINKSIWNAFAGAAGGNTIKNYIEEDNAIKAIERYLSKASEEVKTQVCEFLNNPENFSKTAKSAPDASASTRDSSVPQGTNNYAGYDFDENDIPARYKSNSIYPKWSYHQASTTDEERKEALNYKASGGRNYVEALKTIEELMKNVANRIKSSNASEGLPQDGVSLAEMMLETARNEHAAGHHVIEQVYQDEEERSRESAHLESSYEKDVAEITSKKKQIIIENMTDEERAIYESALADLQEIETKYPNVKTCLGDLVGENENDRKYGSNPAMVKWVQRFFPKT